MEKVNIRKIDAKGRILIPSSILKKYKIDKEQSFIISATTKQIILKPIKEKGE